MIAPDTVPKTAKRPQPKGGSRKGIPNRATKELKELILGALDKAGGEDYLLERAQDPKTQGAFLSLIGKVLPMQVTGENGGALVVKVMGLTSKEEQAKAWNPPK